MMMLINVSLSLILCVLCVSAKNILFMPHPYVVSHSRLLYGLADILHKKGHNVTILRYPATENVENVKTPSGITLIDYYNKKNEWVLDRLDRIIWNIPDSYMDYLNFMAEGTQTDAAIQPIKAMIAQPELMQRLKDAKFDLIALDPHAHPATWIIANKIGAPYVSITPSMSVYYLDRAVGVPVPMSYVSSILSGQNQNMSLYGKVKNIFDHTLIMSAFFWGMEHVVPYLCAWKDTEHRPLMLLTLTNGFLEYPRPCTYTLRNSGSKPRIKEPNLQEVPQLILDIKSNGTVIFSLTTLGKEMLTPEVIKKPFADALAQLVDYRVIWRKMNKNEEIGLENKSHVFTTHWYNQLQTFAHPNTKLLITHGGLASILEAMTHGIPMLMMPLGVDHYANSVRVQSKGLGLMTWQSKGVIEPETILAKVKEILEDKGYYERATQMKNMIEEEKTELMDNPFIFYLEYAARHGNVLRRYLMVRGADQWWWQYYSVDVALAVLAFTFIIT